MVIDPSFFPNPLPLEVLYFSPLTHKAFMDGYPQCITNLCGPKGGPSCKEGPTTSPFPALRISVGVVKSLGLAAVDPVYFLESGAWSTARETFKYTL